MEIPGELYIGGSRVRVEFTDQLDDRSGQFERNTYRILLADDQNEANDLSTLLHEILHLAWAEAGLHSDKQVSSDAELEEKIVGALERPLFHVLLQNPDLVRCFLGDPDNA